MVHCSHRSDREAIIADAASSEAKSPAERVEMFVDLLAAVDAVWAHLPPEERRRRMEIADRIHRRPDPWWKNLRFATVPNDSCSSSSD